MSSQLFFLQKLNLCKAGDLLYCKMRTITECCFNNHSCVGSWIEINRNFGLETAAEYLQNKVSQK